MNILHVVTVLAVPSLLSIQPVKYPPCTLEERPSVEVKVVDTSGTVQGNALVTFTVDGGPVQPAECISYWYDPADCELWAAGRETAGTFLVTATRADGTRTAQQEVTVVHDGYCHVVTQSVTLVLPD